MYKISTSNIHVEQSLEYTARYLRQLDQRAAHHNGQAETLGDEGLHADHVVQISLNY